MRIDIATVLDASADRIWEEVQKPRLLAYIAAPLIHFEPRAPSAWPDHFEDGEYLVDMRLFGAVPIGRQRIGISYPESIVPNERILRDNGRGGLAKRWDHFIRITPRSDGRTNYRDTIDINAGFLTPAVVAFARVFYRHRQWRWRRLVRSNFRYRE